MGLVGLVLVAAATLRFAPVQAETIHVQLPTGQFIDPAGAVLTVGRGPQDAILTPDRQALIVTNSGRSTQSFSVVDVSNPSEPRETQRLNAHPNWVGLLWKGDVLYASGGEANKVYRFTYNASTKQLTASGTIKLNEPFGEYPGAAAETATDIARDATGIGKRVAPNSNKTSAVPFPTCLHAAGMALSPDKSELYVACHASGTVAVVDLTNNSRKSLVTVQGFPYDVAVSADGTKIFASDWSQAHLSVVTKNEQGQYLPSNEVPVGRHPSAFALADNGLLYVAHGNDDSIGVVSTKSVPPKHIRTINLQPYADAPKSSIPTDLALSPDQHTLYVTLGGNNAVAVIDLDDLPSGPSDLRYIPTGWFPTAVQATEDAIYVTSAKGLGSGPNALPTDPGVTTQIFGTVQVITDPMLGLDANTAIVRDDNSFDVDRIAEIPSGTAMYDHAKRKSTVIQNVILVVRENKTFDQVLGDMSDLQAQDMQNNSIYNPAVRGDPLLTRYGYANTPNTHELAKTFVIADEFRAPVEESFTGHQWLNHGQISDVAQRTWSTDGRNVGIGIHDASAPGEGDLLDRSREAGLTYKTYGWDGLQVSGRPQNLTDFAVNTNQGFPTGLQYYTRDIDRIQALLADMKTGQLPNFSYAWIPNDHTYGGDTGARTPQSMVADNDWAVGKIVEGLSESKYWGNTVVFFVEDDPQSGRDHIDSHRTVFLAASPWIKRGHLTHKRYDFSSLHRTVELILGLKPTSQYEDKAAKPLTAMFRTLAEKPVWKPYVAVEPGVSPNDLNPPGQVGTPLAAKHRKYDALTDKVDFSQVDQDEEIMMEVLDGMYHDGLWKYGPGLAPKPSKDVLARERAHPAVEELLEEAEEDASADRVLGVALHPKGGSGPSPRWFVLPLLLIGALALRRSVRSSRT